MLQAERESERELPESNNVSPDGANGNSTEDDNDGVSADGIARKEQHGECSKRISELEEALKLETRRRQELEHMWETQTPQPQNNCDGAKATMTEMTSSPKHSLNLQMVHDDSVVKLLDRASALLSSENDGLASANAEVTSTGNDEGMKANARHYHLTYPTCHEHDTAATTTTTTTGDATHPTTTTNSATKEKMEEYHELVTEFHTEQQNSQDELIAKEDVLWFFDQLQWRFEEIRSGYEAEWKEWMEDSALAVRGGGVIKDNFNRKEWRECLMGLVDVVGRATEQSSGSSLSLIDGETDNRALCRNVEAETKLDHNHQLCNQHQHHHHQQQLTETPISPRKHTERSGNATIRLLQNEITHLNQRLSSFAKHHNDTCNSLYHDMETMKLDNEERIYDMSRNISRLESELSEKNKCIAKLRKDNEHDRLMMEDVKSSLELTKEGTKARIKYLEDTVIDLERELKKERSINVAVMKASAKNDDSRSNGNMSHSLESDGSNDAMMEVQILQKEIERLGNELAESENERAQLLEDFQVEREQYIAQYRQISDTLKQFM